MFAPGGTFSSPNRHDGQGSGSQLCRERPELPLTMPAALGNVAQM
jgi:hypothetical protein